MIFQLLNRFSEDLSNVEALHALLIKTSWHQETKKSLIVTILLYMPIWIWRVQNQVTRQFGENKMQLTIETNFKVYVLTYWRPFVYFLTKWIMFYYLKHITRSNTFFWVYPQTFRNHCSEVFPRRSPCISTNCYFWPFCQIRNRNLTEFGKTNQ